MGGFVTERVAIVTGGAGGIGSAISHRLAADGYHVVAAYLSAEAVARELVGSLGEQGYSVSSFKADISKPDQVAALFDDVLHRRGRVDVVVNNAGTAEYRTLADLDVGTYQKIFDVNVLGAVNVLREAGRHLGEWGRVINISSTLVQTSAVGSAAYAASKAALEIFGKIAAKELGERFITVNSLRVGPTEPGMFARASAERRRALAAASPFGRLGQPQDVADVVSFLASDGGRWITGQVITVDGGAAALGVASSGELTAS